MPRRRIALLRDIARQRVQWLFYLATIRAKRGDIDLARRYIEIMLRVASKAKLKLPRRLKRSYCRRCYAPLIPGITLSVRIRSEGKGSRVVYKCLLCGWIRRFPVKTSGRESRSA